MDRLLAKRAFLAVLDSDGFTRAAAKMDLSVTKVSKLVSELEGDLQLRLLERTTRKVRPTEAGLQYAARLRGILSELDDLEDSLLDQDRRLTGTLKLAAPLDYGKHVIAELIPGFLAQHPGIHLQIDYNDRRVDLVDEYFDLAIRVGDLEDSALVARQISSVRLVLVGSPEYLNNHPAINEPEDIREHQCLGYTLFSWGNNWAFTNGEEERRVRVDGPLKCNNGEAIVIAAERHMGISYQPEFMVREALRDGRLVNVLPQWCQRVNGVYAVYPNRNFLPFKVRAFIDYLAAKLEN